MLATVHGPDAANENRIFTQADYTRTDASSGSSIASFLLGTPGLGTVNYPYFFIYMKPYVAPWVQHDWKVTTKLTLNLGLRLDLNFLPNERFKRINWGGTQVVNPLDKSIDHTKYPEIPNPLRGCLLFANEDGAPRRASTLYWKMPQPRPPWFTATPSALRCFLNPSIWKPSLHRIHLVPPTPTPGSRRIRKFLLKTKFP